MGVYQVRFAAPEDVPACVELEPTMFGCAHHPAQRKVCTETLQNLLRSQRALCAVMTDDAHQPVAFGMSMFITDETRERLIRGQSERHFIWQELWQAIREADEAKGRRRTPYPILNPREVVRAHQGEGLNYLGFYGWRRDLPRNEMMQVLFLLWEGFMLLHRGYYLKSFLKEVYGEQERKHYKGLGMKVYRKPSHYKKAIQGHKPYLVGITRDELRPSTRAFDLFKTPAPRVKLTPRMREVAQLAYLFHLSDREIAGCLTPRRRQMRPLGVSDSDVRWIWSNIKRYLSLQNGSGNSTHVRDECLRYIRCYPEVIYPLHIHGHFYNHPELAQRYFLPLPKEAPLGVAGYFDAQPVSAKTPRSEDVPEKV